MNLIKSTLASLPSRLRTCLPSRPSRLRPQNVSFLLGAAKSIKRSGKHSKIKQKLMKIKKHQAWQASQADSERASQASQAASERTSQATQAAAECIHIYIYSNVEEVDGNGGCQ